MKIMDFCAMDFCNNIMIVENKAYIISKINARFKYIPIYDMLLMDIRKNNKEALMNYGISHFDYSSDKEIITEAWGRIKSKFNFALINN